MFLFNNELKLKFKLITGFYTKIVISNYDKTKEHQHNIFVSSNENYEFIPERIPHFNVELIMFTSVCYINGTSYDDAKKCIGGQIKTT